MRLANQLSVFLENKPGTLARMCDELAASDINILALSVGDTADYAVIRLVVSKPDEAAHLLGEAGNIVVENEVLVVELENRIGALGALSHKLSDAGINIDYAYCSVAPEHSQGLLILRTSDPQKVMEVLS